MTLEILPLDFDDQVRRAVQIFWSTRAVANSTTQGGSRGHVVGGKNLDGFIAATRAVTRHCGLPDSAVFTNGRRDLTLPGYYRPTKNWDAVMIHQQRLLAVLEFKSQADSFGNNFNNRVEEAIGNASDLWVAAQTGACLPTTHNRPP